MNMNKKPIGRLQTGLPVYDRGDRSHISSEIAQHIPAALAQIAPTYERGHLRGGSYTATLPEVTLPLYRVPIAPGDQLYLAKRQGRVGGRSIFVNKAPSITSHITVVLGFKDRGRVLTDRAILVTAFAGTPAPREPWDPWYQSGRNPKERAYRLDLRQTESVDFWTKEALVLDQKVFPLVTDPEPFDPAGPQQLKMWIDGQ